VYCWRYCENSRYSIDVEPHLRNHFPGRGSLQICFDEYLLINQSNNSHLRIVLLRTSVGIIVMADELSRFTVKSVHNSGPNQIFLMRSERFAIDDAFLTLMFDFNGNSVDVMEAIRPPF
jgi:hypothetical protein